ncbi:MAG: hypothetical protein HY903_22730 [Deltaproteobacteria bacterium]|nr:hypothetical protein [Deltaproteobacteria bacterium]
MAVARALALAGAVVLFGLAPAAAAARNRNLVKAEKAYADLDYGHVERWLQKAQKSQLSPEETVAVFELYAFVHAIYGRDEQAREAFLEVLKRKPEYLLAADTSPKLRGVFLDAKRTWEAQGSPVAPAPPVGAGADAATAERDPDEPAEELKLAALPPVTVETKNNAVPDAVMRRNDPLAVESVSHRRAAPFYTRWWFYAAVGVVVVGASGALVWALSRPEPPSHDFGPVPLK